MNILKKINNYYNKQIIDINKKLNTVKSLINLNSDNWKLIIITNICNIDNDEIFNI